jgi:hypothetical protein
MLHRRVLIMLGAILAAAAPAAQAAPAPTLWPPAGGPGHVHAHFGEEHLDDLDGPAIFPKVIADTIKFSPDIVVATGDKSSNGTEENLTSWKNHMQAYDRAGIPYMAGLGNHDREALPGFPKGVSPFSPLGPYLPVFADRPYPFGDGPPVSDPAFSPKQRPADDPDGASSHYSFDYGNVRWIILDNSCFSFETCDGSQNPPFPHDGSQDSYAFIVNEAAEAKAKGMLVFVQMHMPTQDPRLAHTQPTPGPHTMGEGSAPDNQLFEAAASAAEVDGVFAAHIKGQWIYSAMGVPYYIDGGAGGEVYVDPGGEVGVDTGYWHGWRMIRVNGKEIITDIVPVFVPGGVSMRGPTSSGVGATLQFEAIGKQPTEKGPLVDDLELRDPDRTRENGDNLPEPARIWTSGNPLVLAPVTGKDDDPRRDKSAQTEDGRFAARCPGRSRITITSGIERASRRIRVKSRKGKIVRSVEQRGGAVRVRLRQPAVVAARIQRRGRLVSAFSASCVSRSRTVSWNGRKTNGKRARPGRYTMKMIVRSDRRPVVRRITITLRRSK